jgi:hypothetical protein
VLFFVKAADRRLCLGVVGHFDKAETFAATGVAIGDNFRTLD